MGKLDKLIKKLITEEPELSIILDYAPNVTIMPVILDEDSTANPKNIGRLEYQVSDGMVGERGSSNNEYTWENAKKEAVIMQKEFDKLTVF